MTYRLPSRFSFFGRPGQHCRLLWQVHQTQVSEFWRISIYQIWRSKGSRPTLQYPIWPTQAPGVRCGQVLWAFGRVHHQRCVRTMQGGSQTNICAPIIFYFLVSFVLNLYSSMSFLSVGSLLATGYSAKSGRSFCSMTSISLGLKTMCPSSILRNWSRPNFSFRNKAVSDGALSFYQHRFVHTRISKCTYGNFCDTAFDPADPDHQQRLHNGYTDFTGVRLIKGFFSVILPKVSLSSSFVIARCWLMCLPRTRKFRRPRSSDALITGNANPRISSRGVLFP